ncbi:wd40 repeat protein [Anaeramoeba flamelloides]|uniref:Wd40 repeat protein n=1 Tax=Anaeramoeba flamelloides TaxID=1746091 RepID=A0ABQ8XGQ5_9EUKA|nr:wd40 repeat protein [Anaeramoeba flamelloides]
MIGCNNIVFQKNSPIVALSFGKQLRVLDYSTKKEIKSFEYDNSVSQMAFDQDGNYFAVGLHNKKFFVYDSNFETIHSDALKKGNPGSIIFHPTEKSILITDNVYSYKIPFDKPKEMEIENEKQNKENEKQKKKQKDTNEHKAVLGHTAIITKALMTFDKKFYITCDIARRIRVSNFPEIYDIHVFCLGHIDSVTSMDIHPTSNEQFLTGGGTTDNSIILWNLQNGEIINQYKFSTNTNEQYHKKAVLELSYCPKDPKYFVAILKSVPTPFLFQINSKKEIELVKVINIPDFPQDDEISNVRFDQNSNLWVSFQKTQTIKILKFQNWEENLTELKNYIKTNIEYTFEQEFITKYFKRKERFSRVILSSFIAENNHTPNNSNNERKRRPKKKWNNKQRQKKGRKNNPKN